MKRYLLILVMCVWHGVVSANIETKVVPLKVTLGETIRLTLSTQGVTPVGTRPNLLPLQQDFNLVGTQQSMSYSVSNGQAHAVTQWVILLTAKQTGTIVIPSIQIGQEKSVPSHVEVVAGTAPVVQHKDKVSDESSSIQLKTEVSNAHPYINEQVIYTVKLFHNQRLVDADYQPPSIDDALMFPLGDGQSYQSVLDGEVYAVEEQQYAVFPQKSGQLNLVAPTFQALIYDDGPKRVRALAQTTALDVKPVPNAYSNTEWFPAKQVKLTEVYSNHDAEIEVGSTLVRTVTLQAVGVPAQLLPNLQFDVNDKVRVYPEKPDIDNVIRQKELVSKTVIKVTYLFNQTGSVSIPPLSLKWFNTVTGQEETASLPSLHLNIKAKTGIVSPPKKPAFVKKGVEIQKNAQNAVTHVPEETFPVAWIIVMILACGWGGTLIVWWLSHRSLSIKRGKRMALKRLQKACLRNQPTSAREALLQWAALQWQDANILNISDLSRVIHDAALKKQLLLLSHALYSQDGKIAWRGDALWHSVARHRVVRRAAKHKGHPLPPINPF